MKSNFVKMKEFFTLRKLGMASLAFALALVPSSAQQLRLNKPGQEKIIVNGHEVSRILPCGNASAVKSGQSKTPKTKASSVVTVESQVLIDEDFSLITEGSAEEPYQDEMLCWAYGDPGWYVDSKYTHDDGWTGTRVYQAGGMVALMDPTGYSGACLNTPTGDYSGDLTITFRAKALPSYEKTSTLFVSAVIGGFNDPQAAQLEGESGTSQVNFAAGSGWKEVTVTMRNLSANADGYIQFNCYGHILLDDIKVVSATNFLASPNVQGVVEFNDSDFTVAWDPVRAAANYYVSLYKKEFTSDEGLSFSAHFDDATMPDGWTFSPAGNESFSDEEGKDGTAAIILHNGDTLTMPNIGAAYKTMTFFMNMVAEEDPDDPYALYYAKITVSGLSSGKWSTLGNFYGYYFMGGYDVDMVEAAGTDFAGKYESVRFTVTGIPEGGYLVLDNFDVTTDRSYEYVEVTDDALSYAGYFYDMTSDTQYTFKNLDPLGDYYYNVRSHYLRMESDATTLYRAFGVAAPKLLPATDIDERGSYTANWELAPKATRYLITNYGLTTVAEDGTVALLEEDFDKVDADVTSATEPLSGQSLGNVKAISLDDYTAMPGWTGKSNTLAQGFLGCGYGSETSPWIKTPEMSLGNASQFYLTINAKGYYGSALTIDDGTTTYTISYEANDDGYTGYIDAKYIVPVTADIEQLRFYDKYNYPFAFDYLMVEQDVKAGAKIYTPVGTYEAAADETSHTFTGLDAWDFESFAYSAMSYLDEGDDVATSKVNRYMLVDLVNGTSTSGINSLDLDGQQAQIVAIYSLDGTRLATPQKGINIVKLSDGRTIKQIVK